MSAPLPLIAPKETPRRPWPTLAGRLNQPRTSLVDAVRQLAATMPLSRIAQAVLKEKPHE